MTSTPQPQFQWAKANFANTLTPEEERLRDALPDDTPLAKPPIPKLKITKYSISSLHQNLNSTSKPPVSRKPQPAGLAWSCPTCGAWNRSYKKNCMKCDSTKPQGDPNSHEKSSAETTPKDSTIPVTWTHLKSRKPLDDTRETTPGEASVETPQVDDIRKLQQAQELTRAREQREREERTRDGRYIGFKGVRYTGRRSDTDQQVPSPQAQVSGIYHFKPGQSNLSRAQTSDEPLRRSEDTETNKKERLRNAVPDRKPSESESSSLPEVVKATSQDTVLSKNTLKMREEFIMEPDVSARSAKVDSIPYGKVNDRARARRKQQWISDYDDVDEDRADARAKRQSKRQRKEDKAARKKELAPPTPIILPDFISVSNLASVLRVGVEDLVQTMKSLGYGETDNDHVLDNENAGFLALEYNFDPTVDSDDTVNLYARPAAEDKSSLPSRPPIVTIMGHVDHGKTTLLDWLRKSSVVASEHGGITQHIGAFSISMPSGKMVTFLDTPGHAAFLSMRQRGANVTDIVILVVAADDSVKPQTVEAIKHAQAANVPIIVAVNKIDKEDSNVERVKQDLARHGVDVEDYGGDTQVVCVSGKTGQGMEELEEAAVALADILDMRAETDGPAEGWVLEAATKTTGRVATVLVRRGTIRPSDVIVAGTSWARVRGLRNEAGVQVLSAGPGIPVEIDGWRELPSAGDEVLQAPDEQKAKSVVAYRLDMAEAEKRAADMTAVNEARRVEREKRKLEKRKSEEPLTEDVTLTDGDPEVVEPPQSSLKEVFFIIKADVSGSAEAIVDSVCALSNSYVQPTILRSAVGQVTESDIDHAAAANGHIISFNTPIDAPISRMAEIKGVRIFDQNIIYRLVDEVKTALEDVLDPIITRSVVGEAEVGALFEISGKGREKIPVAGCRVRYGVVSKGGLVSVRRGAKVVYEGTVASLRNVKKDVTEMRKGTECGVGFEGWVGMKVGDVVACFEEVSERRRL